MYPGCAQGHSHAESLLILVSSLPGYHQSSFFTERSWMRASGHPRRRPAGTHIRRAESPSEVVRHLAASGEGMAMTNVVVAGSNNDNLAADWGSGGNRHVGLGEIPGQAKPTT